MKSRWTSKDEPTGKRKCERCSYHDQSSLAMNENAVDPSKAAISGGPLRVDASNNASPSRTQSVYRGGYENMIGRLGTCFPDTNVECLENGYHGIYNDSSSLLFHGHPQMQQRSHAPFMPVPPTISGHGRLYNAQELPNSDLHHHQRLVSPNISYVTAQNPFSQSRLPDNIELPGDDNRLGPWTSYPPPSGSLGGGSSFSQHSGGFKFWQQGLEGIESGELWADWSKPVKWEEYIGAFFITSSFSKANWFSRFVCEPLWNG
ncbi:DOMAIN-CONTAINING PROTEIN putative-RELATED [Salix purpurea]|uniref:DOMAIN-CONTAINING PROTEIN putative-RELATED n=1 Tax=Salix purpurea TaxID=77065 RepID=A0A9Q0TK19_SALPP|nr:DOMAIN-CONTAINING PROTEIN putative-RELATED [Salix purpurea]